MNWLWSKADADQQAHFLTDKNQYGNTAFHFAVLGSRTGVMDWLWDHHSTPEQRLSFFTDKSKNGNTVFHISAWRGEIQVLEWLWSRATAEQKEEVFCSSNSFQDGIFHLAVSNSKNSTVVLDWLWEKVPECSVMDLITKVNKLGITPFMKALFESRKEIIDWLWSKVEDKASLFGDEEHMFGALLYESALPYLSQLIFEDGKNVLHKLVLSENYTLFTDVLRSGIPQELIFALDESGKSSYDLVSESGNVELLGLIDSTVEGPTPLVHVGGLVELLEGEGLSPDHDVPDHVE